MPRTRLRTVRLGLDELDAAVGAAFADRRGVGRADVAGATTHRRHARRRTAPRRGRIGRDAGPRPLGSMARFGRREVRIMDRRGWAIAGLLLFAIAPGPAFGDEPPLPEAARKAIEARDWPGVVSALVPAADGTKSVAVHFWLALAYARGGDGTRALRHVEQARALDPGDPSVAVVRALVAGDVEMDWKKDRLAEDPRDFPDVARAQGLAYDARFARLEAEYKSKPWRRSESALGELSRKALRALEDAIEGSEAEDAAVLWRAGFHALETGRPEKAVEYLGRSLAIEPGGWEVHLHFARALTRVGRHAEAAPHFDRAIESAPRSALPQVPSLRASAASVRAAALLEAGRADDAVRAYRELLRLDPGFVGARRGLGDAAFAAGDLELALWAFGEAKVLEKDWAAPYWTGRCLFRLGRTEDAERLMRETIAAAAKHNATWQERGERYHAVPRPWRHWLARAQWDLGRRDEAVKTVLGWNWSDLDLAYARWAFQACLQTEDPYGAVQVCAGLGSDRAREAVEGIHAVLAKWPTPRAADLRAKKRLPHTFAAHLALADIHARQHDFATAADHYVKGGYLLGTWAESSSGVVNGAWALHHAGRLEEAASAFAAIAAGSASWRARARVGRATALLELGRPDEVLRELEQASDAEQAPNVDALRLWAGVAAGAGAPRGPGDLWTLLGVVAAVPKYGVSVRAVLRGGALADAPLPLRPGDTLWRVGTTHVTDDAGIAALRALPVPSGPVEVEVHRGSRRLTFAVDLAAAAARVAAASPAPGGAGR